MHRLLIVLIFQMLFITDIHAQEPAWLFASLLEAKTIVTFKRNPVSGELVRRGETTCPAEPACMGVSTDRRTLFVSFRSTGQLASFRINPENGQLKLLSVVEGGEDPAYLLPDKSGKFLLSAYYQSNKVCVHRIGEDGSISAEPVQTIPTAEKAHGIVFDSKNEFAFVTHTGANRIYQFRFDKKTGHLTANNPPFLSTDEADHPRHIALHPSDKWAYVSNEAGDSVGVYEADREQGTLKFLQRLSTIPEEFDGSQNSTARCEMTPDGRFVYVANRGHDSIAGFAIDQISGRVTSLGQTPTEQTPRSFTIDSNGKFLYAAGQGSGKMATFRILDTGQLERIATYDSGPVSWWVVAVDPPAEPVKLDTLRWMLGHWTHRRRTSVTRESWQELNPQTFQGEGVTTRIDNNQVSNQESLYLLEMSGSIYYLAKVHQNEYPIPFKLTSGSARHAVFENPDHDFPKKIEYQLSDAGELNVTVGDGKDRSFQLQFQRDKQMSALPLDIRQRVESDFGPERADAIYEYLLDKIPEGLPNGTRPRHLRCILYLAKGDEKSLEEAIRLCLSDPRDVMLAAEYETGPRGGLKRKRDFQKPFDQSRIDP